MLSPPTYSFTIPSLYDDTPLECRIYHPKALENRVGQDGGRLRGAVVGHPYAPLGGSFDDGVVLALTQCLVKQGFVVGTFNFRGASGSKGSTSWTGRPEKDDYIAFAGFMIYYLYHLGGDNWSGHTATSQNSQRALKMLLAGYSYGSLILSKILPIPAVIQRFETAERGTAAAEIIMRARRLARAARETRDAQSASTDSRGRQVSATGSTSSASQHTRPSPVVIGGEETDASERRRSRDTRRSASVVREVPRRIKAHIRHYSDGHKSLSDSDTAGKQPSSEASSSVASSLPVVSVSYLLISPVLPPLSHTLVSPSSLASLLSTSKGAMDKDTGIGSLQQPSLVVFGSTDGITSAKRLKAWCEKLASQSPDNWQWAEIDRAGHFWREENTMRELTRSVSEWVKLRVKP